MDMRAVDICRTFHFGYKSSCWQLLHLKISGPSDLCIVRRFLVQQFERMCKRNDLFQILPTQTVLHSYQFFFTLKTILMSELFGNKYITL